MKDSPPVLSVRQFAINIKNEGDQLQCLILSNYLWCQTPFFMSNGQNTSRKPCLVSASIWLSLSITSR